MTWTLKRDLNGNRSLNSEAKDANIHQEHLVEQISCGTSHTVKHFHHAARLPQWLHNRLPLGLLRRLHLTKKSLVRQDCTIHVKEGLFNPIKEGKI